MSLLDKFKARWCGSKPDTMKSAFLATDVPGVTAATLAVPRFIGPQKGEAADVLASDFRQALLNLPQIQRAYFCRVSYASDEKDKAAAICLIDAGGEQERAVESMSEIIRRHLSIGFTIDIMFLTEKQETGLAEVCKPFYTRS